MGGNRAGSAEERAVGRQDFGGELSRNHPAADTRDVPLWFNRSKILVEQPFCLKLSVGELENFGRYRPGAVMVKALDLFCERLHVDGQTRKKENCLPVWYCDQAVWPENTPVSIT